MRDEATNAWLSKAVEDEYVFELIDATGKALSLAAYHLQQAAEKRLKALLASKLIRPKRSHDLVELASQLVATSIPEVVHEALVELSALAWTTRYPGAQPVEQASLDRYRGHYRLLTEWIDTQLPPK